LEAIKTQNAVLLQEVEQLRHDERKILDFIAKENAVGGLFPAQVEEWLKIKTKYAKA
jgi:demethoxyubiquinone hydroxylase (CLK1/Coq7/Cat5 family)